MFVIADQMAAFSDKKETAKSLYNSGSIRTRVAEYLFEQYIGSKPEPNKTIDKLFDETVAKMALITLVPSHLSEELFNQMLSDAVAVQVQKNTVYTAESLIRSIKVEIIIALGMKLVYDKIHELKQKEEQ